MHPRNEWFLVASSMLCVVSWLHLATASVIQRPQNPDHTEMLDLFRSILLNDNKWHFILHQKIIATAVELPVKHDVGGITAEMGLVGKDEKLIEIGPIVRKVLEEYSWLGSYVTFATRLMTVAFMCFTYVNVLLIVEMMLVMEHKYELEKESYPKGIYPYRKQVLIDTLSTFVMLVDKLGAVNGRLNIMGDVLYEYNESIDSERIVQLVVMQKMKKLIGKQISHMCEIPDRDQVFLNLEFSYKGKLDHPDTKLNKVRIAISQVMDRIASIYDNFKLESLPLSTWGQVLDYQDPVNKKIDPYLIIEDKSYDSSVQILKKAKTTIGSKIKELPFDKLVDKYNKQEKKEKKKQQKD